MDNEAVDIVEEGDGEGGEEPTSSAESQETARLSGWTPVEDFKGDKERWVDADAWNERAEKILPIATAQNKKYERQIKELKETVDLSNKNMEASKETIAKMLKVQESVSEQAYQRALGEIQKKQKDAAEIGDWDGFEDAQKEQADLEKPEQVTETAVETPTDPNQWTQEFSEQWQDENKWYSDPKEFAMQGFGMIEAQRLQKEGVTGQKEQLAAVSKAVREKFPDYFGNKRRATSAIEGGDDDGGGTSKTSSFDKLPKEAKAQYEVIKISQPDYTKKEYVEAYNE